MEIETATSPSPSPLVFQVVMTVFVGHRSRHRRRLGLGLQASDRRRLASFLGTVGKRRGSQSCALSNVGRPSRLAAPPSSCLPAYGDGEVSRDAPVEETAIATSVCAVVVIVTVIVIVVRGGRLSCARAVEVVVTANDPPCLPAAPSQRRRPLCVAGP